VRSTLPDGANAFDRHLSCGFPKRFRPRNRLRRKANFSRAFKSMTPVQIPREKYSALDSPQISGFISLSRLIEEGRTRRHERGGGMRWTRT
jgi:hypothetical protein